MEHSVQRQTGVEVSRVASPTVKIFTSGTHLSFPI
jgi:hypothetical protein